MSDHGFSPFRRSFNPNTWLFENGYHTLINKWRQGREDLFTNTDWSKTKAYALGLNGLYINQKGREGEGIVNSGAEKEALIREIIHNLESFQDPETGEKPASPESIRGKGCLLRRPHGESSGYHHRLQPGIPRFLVFSIGKSSKKYCRRQHRKMERRSLRGPRSSSWNFGHQPENKSRFTSPA